MPKFRYTVVDSKGVQQTGEADVASEAVLKQKLRASGVTIQKIEKVASGGAAGGFDGFMARFRKVNEQALTVFSRQFATMINAGLSMVRCLQILSEQTEDAVLKEALLKVKSDVEGGMTLSKALKRHSNVFSTLYVSMVEAGELGGVLDEVLERLATFMEKDFALKKKVKSALTYPAVILLMAIGIVAFLVIYILPTFVELFSGLGRELPLPTRILMLITEYARNPIAIGIVVVGMVGLVMAFNAYVKTDAGKMNYDTFKLKVPIFGELTKKVAISRFCRTLGTLLSSGVPIMQALEIVGRASGNEVIAKTVSNVRESIRDGESIASPLSNSGMFPPMVTQMVSVGEETGNLDAMLNKIADFYDTEVEYMLASLTSMLEPIMIVGMGGIVGFIVISVFLPLYQLIGDMGT